MNLRTLRIPSAVAALLAVACSASEARAQAALYGGLGGTWGYGPNSLVPADDSDSVRVDLTSVLPGGLRFHGVTYTDVYINVNGNVSFGGPLATFTPMAFPGADLPLIAAWWADVDTRGTDPVMTNRGIYWSATRVGAFGRLVVTWNEVGYFDQHTDKRNSFQLILSRDDSMLRPGDFDIEFRYATCTWTTGDMSGGTGGLGGMAAIAGYDASDEVAPYFSTLPGSGTAAVLNLCRDSNIDEPGAWRLFVRGGDVALCGNGRVEPGEQCDGPLGLPAGVSCTEECRRCGATEPNPCAPPDGGAEGGTGGDASTGPDVPDVPDVPDAIDEPDVPDVPDAIDEPDAAGMDASAPDVPDVTPPPDAVDEPDASAVPDVVDEPDEPDAGAPPDAPAPDEGSEVGEPDDVAVISDTVETDAVEPTDVPEPFDAEPPVDAEVAMDAGADAARDVLAQDARGMDAAAEVGAEAVVERYNGAGLFKCSVPDAPGASNGLPALGLGLALFAARRRRRRRDDDDERAEE